VPTSNKQIDPMTRSSTPAAERARRYRQRRRSGMRCVTIRLSDAEIDMLVARRYLGADGRDDTNAVQAAMEAFLADELG
jgi:hypothetical protein